MSTLLMSKALIESKQNKQKKKTERMVHPAIERIMSLEQKCGIHPNGECQGTCETFRIKL